MLVIPGPALQLRRFLGPRRWFVTSSKVAENGSKRVNPRRVGWLLARGKPQMVPPWFIYKYKLKLLRWYTGTLSHNSALVYPMLALINISWWYTGRMAHGSDVVYTLLPNQLQFDCNGTLAHCHTTLILCTLCWLQSGNIYIMLVHWYTVTQLLSCEHSASLSSSIYIAVVHCHTTLILCILCWLR
jgi:hypothetical protein